jgi:UDP-N-acetylmuramoyl-tripeptide--D-alanyl-D-alanine ligase
VVELGMDKAGEIEPLSVMTQPHLALITTVEAVHLMNFDSVDQIADAKAEIFAGLTEGGTAILNSDNPYFERLEQAALAAGAGRVIAFGTTDAAHVRLMSAEVSETGTHAVIRLRGRKLDVPIGAPGEHLAMNAAAALAAIEASGADAPAAAKALASWAPPEGRGSRWRISLGDDGEFVLVDESFNANPASVGAAMDAFLATAPDAGLGGRRILFLTDMLELGDQAPEMHAGLATHAAMAQVDIVYAAGPLMRHLFDALPLDKRGGWVTAAEELANHAGRIARPGDAILVKGSKGSLASKVAAALRDLGPARQAAAT